MNYHIPPLDFFCKFSQATLFTHYNPHHLLHLFLHYSAPCPTNKASPVPVPYPLPRTSPPRRPSGGVDSKVSKFLLARRFFSHPTSQKTRGDQHDGRPSLFFAMHVSIHTQVVGDQCGQDNGADAHWTPYKTAKCIRVCLRPAFSRVLSPMSWLPISDPLCPLLAQSSWPVACAPSCSLVSSEMFFYSALEIINMAP